MTTPQDSTEMAPNDPRWIAIRPSKTHLAIVTLGTALACVVLLWVPLPIIARLSLLLLVIATGAWNVLHILQKNTKAIAAFYLMEAETGTVSANAQAPASAQGIRLRYRHSDSIVEGVVGTGAFVSPWFSTIAYRLADDPSWRRRFPRIITLWRDALDAEAFRLTRVRLRWK